MFTVFLVRCAFVIFTSLVIYFFCHDYYFLFVGVESALWFLLLQLTPFIFQAHHAPPLLIMNSLHSLHSVKPLKPLSDEVDEQNTEVQLPKLPISPSMIGRACPGQAALANSTLNPVSPILSNSPPFSSLMRFINSSVFSVNHAVHYLNERSASKDWDYLGEF